MCRYPNLHLMEMRGHSQIASTSLLLSLVIGKFLINL